MLKKKFPCELFFRVSGWRGFGHWLGSSSRTTRNSLRNDPPDVELGRAARNSLRDDTPEGTDTPDVEVGSSSRAARNSLRNDAQDVEVGRAARSSLRNDTPDSGSRAPRSSLRNDAQGAGQGDDMLPFAEALVSARVGGTTPLSQQPII